MGDVKYHAGARTAGAARVRCYVTMPPNPSHLEAVNPVVVGMARAAGTVAEQPGAPRFDGALTLPILIHGDAAFPGQGIVAETLNLSRLTGYDTDGTIHIIANNQLGFTATPDESYSTSYASGLARGFKIPIVHVNADDPVGCLEAARLAWEYRARFRPRLPDRSDRLPPYGHNEGDEPAFTQPLMYKAVAAHPTVRELFAEHAGQRRDRSHASRGRCARQEALHRARAGVRVAQAGRGLRRAGVGAGARRHRRRRTETGVPLARLREINAALLAPPARLHVPQEARTRSRAAQAAAGQSRPSERSTGPPPRSWRLPRSSPTASRSG